MWQCSPLQRLCSLVGGLLPGEWRSTCNNNFMKGKILQIEPGESQPGLAKRGIENTTGCCHSRAGGWVGQQGGELEEGKFERRKASQGFHLCQPRDDAVSSGLDHSLLSVDLLLRWSLDKRSSIIPISVIRTNRSGQH